MKISVPKELILRIYRKFQINKYVMLNVKCQESGGRSEDID